MLTIPPQVADAADPQEQAVPAPTPRRGGEIRVLVDGAPMRRAVVRSAVAEPLAVEHLLKSWFEPSAPGACWELAVDRSFAFPDGERIGPGQLLEGWSESLAESYDARHWALAFARSPDLVGQGVRRLSTIAALSTRETNLVVCPDRPAGPLLDRFEHPELWHWRTNGEVGRREGGGPFRESEDGSLVANPGHPGPGPYVTRVEQVSAEGNPALLFKLGDAHVAIAYGKRANALLLAEEELVRVERAPAWDRTYFLWFNAKRRWINDPTFRSWIAGAIDRDAIVDYLFDGLGERAFALSREHLAVPHYPLQADRPLASSTVPRLTLHYDEEDPQAQTLVARLTASMATDGVELQPVNLDRDGLRATLERGEFDVALLRYGRPTGDPLLDLLDAVWWLGPAADAETLALLDAAAVGDERTRRERAWQIERSLLGDSRIVPIVRLEAWLATHPKLAGVDASADGVLRLGEAWWAP